MAVKKVYNLSVPQPGGQKTRWQNIGVLMVRDDGSMSVKLDAVPTHAADRDGNLAPWDGWIKVFEQTRGDDSGGNARQNYQSGGAGRTPVDDDEIPF